MRAEELKLGELARWYFGAAELWPDVYSIERLARYWSYAESILDDGEIQTEAERRRMRVGYLRGALLKMLRNAVDRCGKCPLHANRLPQRPVLDDGAISSDPFWEYDEELAAVGPLFAEIMMVGEGPGQFEQRTGIPFVSFGVLAGSFCASQCEIYDRCYNEKSPFPQGRCEFTPLAAEGAPEARAMGRFKIHTAGNILDHALVGAGLWRESWNARFRLWEKTDEKTAPRPGSVYLTNVVKCRSVDESGKDLAPPRESADACRTYFEQQLYIVQPKVLVALGGPAVKFLTDMRDPKVLSIRGQVYLGEDQLPVVVEAHPSWILRQENLASQKENLANLTASLEIAKQIVAGTYKLPWIEEQVQEVMAQAVTSDPFADPEAAEFGATFPGGEIL